MSESKYKLIAQELLAEITAGKYEPTGRLPSEAQLVKRYEVSRPTAAMALRQLQDQGLIERRAGSGSFVRRKQATNEQGQRRIGLLAPELQETEILDAICGDLARLARLHDFNLLWGEEFEDRSEVTQANSPPLRHAPSILEEARTTSHAPGEFHPLKYSRSLCQPFLEQDVCGVFFAPFECHAQSRELNHRITDLLKQAGISIILLDRDIYPFPIRSEFDLVGIDNFAGGYMAAMHLLKLGCKRLVFLAPPLTAPTVTHRIAGAREAALDFDGKGISLRVERFEPDEDKPTKKLAATADAVVCSCDRVAATLMQALARIGVEVPRDLQLVGFDDVNYARLLTVPLTTIHQPCRDIAVVAFRAMLDSIEKAVVPPRQYLLPGQLIVRESCGAYKNKA